MQMLENSPLLLVITGPTGIGKTDLAISLAQDAPLRLISADSVMVYEGLDIGSAKPSAQELAQCPHDLIDIVPPEHPFDAGQFVAHATQAIEEAWVRGQIPCLVGGTIMYLKVLLDGLDFLPQADPEIRSQIRDRADKQGWPAIHQWLIEIDPKAGKMIHPNHSSRIERALEVKLLTGRSISSFWTGGKNKGSIGGRFVDLSVLALVPADRNKLKGRLDDRFGAMLMNGLVEEVIALRLRSGLRVDCPSMKSVGYQQVWRYLDNQLSDAEMKESARAATRQLAKRQLTWLRSWRHETNNFLEVSQSIPLVKGREWLSEVFGRVF